jgi:hypothetical protein
MSLSIFDIANGISWTDEGHFYLTQKEEKYELLVEYLNSAGNYGLNRDLELLRTFHNLLMNKDEKDIDNYIISELEGFQELDNEWYAKIAGAHDLSPTILYKKGDIIYIKHPNLPSIEKFEIGILNLIKLQIQMIEVNSFIIKLKTLEK